MAPVAQTGFAGPAFGRVTPINQRGGSRGNQCPEVKVCGSRAQRRRKSVSPAWGTIMVSGSAP